MSGEDWAALLADGSLRVTRDGALEFEPVPDPDRKRGALARRLVETGAAGPDPGDPADPEQWEAILIAAALRRPETGTIRTARIRMVDYHHATGRAVAGLVALPRPRLEALYLGYDEGGMLDMSLTTSTGRDLTTMLVAEELSFPLVDPGTAGRLSDALPALRRLYLEGTHLFDDLRHETLTTLWLHGAPFDAMWVDSPAPEATWLPQLTTFNLISGADSAGGAASAVRIRPSPVSFPRLRRLDLRGSVFDHGTVSVPAGGDVLDVLADGAFGAFPACAWVTEFEAVAHWPVLPQLRFLGVTSLDTGEDGWDSMDRVARLAPRFAHLEQLAVAEMTGQRDAVQALLPNLVVEPLPGYRPVL
ncbi:hypothetical protein [Virgisporangium aurantiacum]|uniref:Leucine-rich repeat domain-containing protein n=1 Tax=Virgisporangium aurantiacum TaxID=175570 RepID=A0A8J4E132_9ACTN|nr:hypothetical protein [Virgisporangium aurantiacum]GIJ57343.1 hypothetical protein Vau01_048590 [Virgisporangium aurantiacum]